MNNDTKATIVGMGVAMATAIGDFFAHLGPDGVNFKAPTFWVGLAIAALMGAQGFITNKTNKTTVEKTEKVEVTTPAP